MPETLASTPINVTGLAVGEFTPGSNAPVSLVQSKSLSPVWERPSPITTVPATKISSFGCVVRLSMYLSYIRPCPVILKGNLSICSELREGARIGYSVPRCPRFSNNLPTAFLNPEVVTANLTD